MLYYLLLGAGFTRNWGAPLAGEVNGSLLQEFQADPEMAALLRDRPFEEVLGLFQSRDRRGASGAKLEKLQDAIVALFDRINAALADRELNFSNDVAFSMIAFLSRFDAIFTLNQDLLLDMKYMGEFISSPKWSGIVLPGIAPLPSTGGNLDRGLKQVWEPTGNVTTSKNMQPIYKLHGSSNWRARDGSRMLIAGVGKSQAIQVNPLLKFYHERFVGALNIPDSRLMVIGYSFQDEHINAVIENASTANDLGIHIVDLRGLKALADPKMEHALIKGRRRDIEEIRIIGETTRPISQIFGGDSFAFGELMRFFS